MVVPVEVACVVVAVVVDGAIILDILAVETPAMTNTHRGVEVVAAALEVAVVIVIVTVISATTIPRVAEEIDEATVRNEAPAASEPIGTNPRVSCLRAVAVTVNNNRNNPLRPRRLRNNRRYTMKPGRSTWRGKTIAS